MSFEDILKAANYKTRRRIVGSIIALALGLVSIAGESHDATSNNPATPIPTLRVAYAQGIQANFYYALQNGLFEKHHVKVVGVKFDSGPALVSALVAGSVDVGYFGIPTLISADANGAKLQAFGVANVSGKMVALYANPKSGINGVKDLVGKTVATTQNTTGHIFLLIALKQAGIDPKTVRIKFLDSSGLVAGYLRGDLDAVWMFPSVGAKLMVNGAKLIASTSAPALGIEDPGSFVADRAFISENKTTLRNFLAAVDEATPITNGNKEVSLEALNKGVGLVGDQAKIILDQLPAAGITSGQLADPSFYLSLTPMGGYTRITQAMLDTMTGFGSLKTVPVASSLITEDIVSETK
jgi:ABC-type nitrate/sulfonate/bicarbonate transport system substrate-binding protein